MSATAFIYFAIHRFYALTSSIVATKTGEPAPKTSHNDTSPPHWSCSEKYSCHNFLVFTSTISAGLDLSNRLERNTSAGYLLNTHMSLSA
jgi:hypothetical protein